MFFRACQEDFLNFSQISSAGCGYDVSHDLEHRKLTYQFSGGNSEICEEICADGSTNGHRFINFLCDPVGERCKRGALRFYFCRGLGFFS